MVGMKKRAITLTLVLVLVSVCCGCGTSTSKPDPTPVGIPITMDNYKKYIEVSGISIENFGTKSTIHNYLDKKETEFSGYEQIRFEAKISGVSTNFVYNDIKVTFRFEGSYDDYELFIFDSDDVSLDIPFSFDITIDANVAGGGSEFFILETSTGRYTSRDFFNSKANIVDVSGYVTPVSGK